MRIVFTVLGTPQPGGSKRGFHIKALNRVVITDANPRAKDWKAEVRSTAREAASGLSMDADRLALLGDPLALDVRFYFVRPKSHYGSGRNSTVLKKGAPRHHIQRPDVLKCTRLIEDALSKVIYVDDAQIVTECLCKLWAEPGEPARVEVVVSTLEENS